MAAVGLYLRISEDRDGQQTATARQREDCERFAAIRGWDIVDVFEDVDVSAFQRNVRRPEFERLIEAVRSRAIDGVLAWKLDRVSRRMRDFVRLDEAAQDADAFIATVTDGIDTRTPTGRFVAELLTSQARMESENTSIRVKRKHAERAAEGRPNPGGRRPFGYSTRYEEIIEPEAKLIREAMARVLAGEGLRGITIDWFNRGILTPNLKVWEPQVLRRILIGYHLSAQRFYDGKLAQGDWPAILTAAETEQMRRILCDPARVHAPHAARSYLLTGGIAKCGRCGHDLIARPGWKGRRRYVCAKRPGTPNCGGIARQADPVDEIVTSMFFERLRGVDLSAHAQGAQGVEAERLRETILADEAALSDLARDYYVDRLITRPEFASAREAVNGRLNANRQKLAEVAGRPDQRGVEALSRVEARWAGATLDWKRAVLTTIVDSVTIGPALRGRARFDASAITVLWRH